MTELVVTTPEALSETIGAVLRAVLAEQGKSPQSDWLTLTEASQHIKIPEATIRDWVAKRKIPYKKAGGRLLFSRRKLDEWVNDS